MRDQLSKELESRGIIDLREYLQILKFCSYDNETKVEDGVAFRRKDQDAVSCLQDIDFNRGRGYAKRCIRRGCLFYIHDEGKQSQLTEYLGVEEK